MAKNEIIWDEPKSDIVWDDAPVSKTDEIIWDEPEKSTLRKVSDVAVAVFDAPSKISDFANTAIKGLISGTMKFSTLGKEVKAMGDTYLEKANALNKEIDQDVSNRKLDFTFSDIKNGVSSQAPDVKKLLNDRFDFQKNIEGLNKSLQDPNIDPVAKQEIANQINKASMDVTNIDKLVAPAWKNPNEYKSLIDKFNQQRTLTEKYNKTTQIGKNLEAKNQRILNSFTTAEERDTFAYKLGSGIESMAEAVVVSKGVGMVGTSLKLAPKAVGIASQVIPGIALALPGAVDMYDKAIGKGLDPKTARMIAAGDLFANAALESMSFGFIFKGPAKGFIKSAITEGTQELAQTFTDNAITKTWIDRNQDLFEGAFESFAIGGIIGGSVGKVRSQAEIPIMQNVMMRIKQNPKYQESFKAANMNEADIDQMLQRVANKTSEINEVVSEKTFTDEFNKTMGELGKDQPEDATRRKPIEGELDQNNPLQIEQAIAGLNRVIADNEGNPNVMTEVTAAAIKKRGELAERLQEVTNATNIELNPAEITQIQADIKESTGAEISQEQAAAIMREMSDKRVEQIKYQDESVRDTGKTIQIRDERGELQGVTGIPSQRRQEFVGVSRKKLTNADFQQAADTDLIDGYVEQDGGLKVPGNTEYIYAKAVRDKSPELMRKVIENGKEHVKFVLDATDYKFKTVDELKTYANDLEAQVIRDGSQEDIDEFRKIKDDIQEVERINERVEAATQSVKRQTQKGEETVKQRQATDVDEDTGGIEISLGKEKIDVAGMAEREAEFGKANLKSSIKYSEWDDNLGEVNVQQLPVRYYQEGNKVTAFFDTQTVDSKHVALHARGDKAGGGDIRYGAGKEILNNTVPDSSIKYDDSTNPFAIKQTTSFAKVKSEKGGQGAKRLDSYLVQEFAKNIGLDIIAVENLGKGIGGGDIIGKAYTEYGQIRLKRALLKGEWGVVPKDTKHFGILRDAGIIDENGVIDATQYNGKLGQLKAILEGVLPDIELEALNSKLLEVKNTDELVEVMAHEVGHQIDAAPDANIDRGNIIGRILSEVKHSKAEHIDVIGSNAQIRKELIALSEWWSPYNKAEAKQSFIKYRESAPELYAEAMSVYINDPQTAKQKAPLFFENFEKNLFRKPGVEEGFKLLEKLRKMDTKALGQYALERGRQSTEFAENLAKKSYEEKTKRPKFKEKIIQLKDEILEEVAIGDLKIRQLLKKQGRLTDLTDLETVNGKMGKEDYLNLSIRKGWISKPKELIAKYTQLWNDFEEKIKPNSTFGQYMINQRIIHDRSGLANPMSVNAAKAAISEIKSQMTEEQFAQVEKDAEKYYEFMDNNLRTMIDYGIMSQEHYDNIKKNNNKYAFFQVAEKEFQKANAAFGNSVPSGIKGQTGTFKDVRNPVASTVELLNKMGWMMELNRFKLEFTNMLKDMPAQEDVIRDVTLGPKGVMPNPDPGYTRMSVLDNSEYKSYDVKTDLYQEYDSTVAQLNKVHGLIRMVRPVFTGVKMALTKLNPAFTVKNPIRDYLDVKTTFDAGIVPGVSSKDIVAYTKNLKDALNISYQAVMNPENTNNILKEAENTGAIIPRDVKWKLDEADAVMSGRTTEILNNIGVTIQNLDQKVAAGETDYKSAIKEGLKLIPTKYDQLMTNVNEISENATKLAFYKTLRDKGFSAPRAAVYTRRFAGTPDPTYGGKHRLQLGTFFGFFNPTVQGNMRIVHALTRTGGLKGVARAKYISQVGGRMLLQPEILIGTVLTWALKRLWDKDPEKNKMLRVSDQTLKRYFVIPAFGKEIRIPRGQMNQVMHEIVWEFMDTLYSAAKGKTNNAQKHMKQFIGSLFMMSGVSFETITPVLKTISEAYVNRDWRGNEIYDKDNSEGIKAIKSAEHILRNTLGGPVPKNWTMGFVNKYTGDAERLEQLSEDFKVAKADILTEMANVYQSKSVDAKRLRKLAGSDPTLVSMAEKSIALSETRKDVIERIKKSDAQGYARAVLNILKSKGGLEATQEIGNVLHEAQRVLSQDDFKALMEYVGIFF